MEGKRMEAVLERIEHLIVDGQKEVLVRIGNLETGQERLETGFQRLEEKVDWIDKKHDTNAQALYGLLQDTRTELGERIDKVEIKIDQVENRLTERIDQVEYQLGEKIDSVEFKLDLHMKQPLHN